MRPSFFHHLHPPTIPARQARFRYTLGAGGISIFLILVLIVTGVLEIFYYIPTPEKAAESIQNLTFLVPYGALIRGLHYWAGQILVAVALVHLLRVLFTGGYAKPRRFNYLLGLGLLVSILFLDFTGYVLRWDEGIRWALVAGTNLVKTIPVLGEGLYRFIMGGYEAGEATLVRFYAWHIFGLTLILTGIGVWHLFRVRRDGGIAVPPPTLRESQNRISRDELVRREALAIILVAGVLILMAATLPAPISAPMASQPANGISSDARAPWFFLWVQQLLRWGDPFTLGVLMPVGVLAALAAIPYILPAPRPEEMGRWFPKDGRLTQILTAAILAGSVALTILALLT
jgi:quinol-cytochrome oxidoreductase complex cytochrome b subunit